MAGKKRIASRARGEAAWSGRLEESRYSQSIERGLAVLVCFTPKRPALGIAEIAEELGMSRSTTHRYVITLVALGYLEQSSRSRKYRLGAKVTDLGLAALNTIGLRELAAPYLEELRHRSACATSMSVLEGTDIVYLDHARILHRELGALEASLQRGSRLPAYCTAMGKLLLANLALDEQRGLIGKMRLTKRAPNTITSEQGLLCELHEIRGEELAVNNEELWPDLLSIAAAVRNEAGEVVAAVSLTARSSRVSVSQLIEDLGGDLLATAERISSGVA
jgi:IclR family transcriptional regulator, pca regulon regulatory protein